MTFGSRPPVGCSVGSILTATCWILAAFAADAEDLLGASVSLLSDAVLGKANVSLDLVHATAL